MTWETEVGTILPWPWKKPRSAEIRQMNRTAGDRQRMANQLSDWLMTAASWRQSRAMPAVPTTPRLRKTSREVWKICRICLVWPRVLASAIIRDMATGRPVVEIISSTE